MFLWTILRSFISTGVLIRLEMISGVERRCRWSVADKLRFVAEADEPNARVAEFAYRHEISRSILSTWRKQARAGELTASGPLCFLAVVVDTLIVVDAPITASIAPPAASLSQPILRRHQISLRSPLRSRMVRGWKSAQHSACLRYPVSLGRCVDAGNSARHAVFGWRRVIRICGAA